MKIRNMLFIVIPLLFLINGSISYLLFSSSNQVNTSYLQLQERLLVYERLNEYIQNHIQLADQWLTTHSKDAYDAFQQGSQQMNNEILRLKDYGPPANGMVDALSYQALIDGYQAVEQLLLASSTQNTLLYSSYLDQAELLSAYIIEDSYRMIGLELEAYEERSEEIRSQVAKMRISGMMLLIGVTLLCLWLAYRISASISAPIRQLAQTAEGIAQGNLDQPVAQYSKQSDFYRLGAAFKKMQQQLKQYIAAQKETLEKDKQLKEMELEVLKSQINPHFLFNSLNVMSKLALIEGAERTSDLTVAMANLLRYNLKQLDTPVPLRDEVKHANDYFYIQQARYRDRVKFETDIDEEQLDTTVPVLTLQPLLENIFVHGIEQLERNAVITLRIYGNTEFTWITIEDNGIGMNEHTKAQLLDYEHRQTASAKQSKPHQSTGLGTRNVFRRLQLLYGAQHEVQIDSREGEGTSITLRIPRQKGDL